MTGRFPRTQAWLTAAAIVVMATTLSSCYVAPYPYRGVAMVGPPVVFVGPHRCWRCW